MSAALAGIPHRNWRTEESASSLQLIADFTAPTILEGTHPKSMIEAQASNACGEMLVRFGG